MKQLAILFVLLAAIVVAAIAHSVRVNTYPIEDGFDRLSVALKNINNVLPANTNVSLRPLGAPIEDILFCNYLLAPRCSRGNNTLKLDTALIMCSLDTQDSILQTAMGKNVIWSIRDDKYRYYLTTGK